MPGFHFQELFELGDDGTEYRSLGSEHVSTQRLGGREVGDTEHMVTETLIRGMYRYWRDVMEA